MEGKKLLHADSYNLPDQASIFQPEIKAIYLAVKHLVVHHKPRHKYIKIFCDSQAALKALQHTIIKCNSVADCHFGLQTLAEMVRKITLVWIKAHVGHPRNELADEYAKLGTPDTNRAAPIYISQTLSLIHI